MQVIDLGLDELAERLGDGHMPAGDAEWDVDVRSLHAVMMLRLRLRLRAENGAAEGGGKSERSESGVKHLAFGPFSAAEKWERRNITSGNVLPSTLCGRQDR